jgi:predicted molibdopterin-dependent oxidoreductase YjgC
LVQTSDHRFRVESVHLAARKISLASPLVDHLGPHHRSALKRPHGFNFQSPREIFDELRIASKGGIADYSGITYEKIEKQYGVFWPCSCEEHAGTPRLFEPGSWNPIANGKGPFYFPDGKAHFNVAKYSPPAEDVDADYPLMLTTGRVISHFLSGTQTRRIGPLVDQCPDPFIEVHPLLAEKLGLSEGDWATAESRRGAITLQIRVVRTIRPDTIFIPYHWAGKQSANQLTISHKIRSHTFRSTKYVRSVCAKPNRLRPKGREMASKLTTQFQARVRRLSYVDQRGLRRRPVLDPLDPSLEESGGATFRKGDCLGGRTRGWAVEAL